MARASKVPSHIRRKLERIEKHQQAIKRLVAEVEAWRPILEKRVIDSDNWTWGMLVDQQGPVMTAGEMRQLLERFLEEDQNGTDKQRAGLLQIEKQLVRQLQRRAYPPDHRSS